MHLGESGDINSSWSRVLLVDSEVLRLQGEFNPGREAVEEILWADGRVTGYGEKLHV